MRSNKVAIIYDFDKTLSPKNMQEFSMHRHMGYDDPKRMWKEAADIGAKCHMDGVLAYMLLVMMKYPGLSNEALREEGKQVKYYPGVRSWFKRINEYGKQRGLEVEHYIISSGLAEILNGSSIAKEFKKIYGCEYAFEEGIIWPSRVVNYTAKTQYIFRINKGVFDADNDADLNKSTKDDEKYVPYSHMIYIGDGYTDVPCMKIVSQYGGNTIAVYGTAKDKEELAKPLFNDKRATFLAKADYREGQEIDTIIKTIIDNIHAVTKLDRYKLGEDL